MPPISVTELNLKIKDFANNLGFLEIRGEIFDYRGPSRPGHLYFSLKDETGTSQISVAIWASVAARFRDKIREGAKVVLSGKVDVYLPRGTYQFVAYNVRVDGAGDLARRFEELKKRLAAEGLFDPATKKRVPEFIKKVAFVTAATGAVIHDFCQNLRNLGFAGTVLLVPAKVQGDGAAADIVRAIRLAEKIKDLDALVVGRGGGSLEDLWAFNEEIVVRAIKACRVPVISAVGHETDFTLCDFAADLRAPTPSIAAQEIGNRQNDLRQRVKDSARDLAFFVENFVNSHAQNLEILLHRLEKKSPENYLKTTAQRLELLRSRLEASREQIFSRSRERLARLQAQFSAQDPQKMLAPQRILLAQLEARLRACGIDSTLNRGFALALNDRGVPVTSAATASRGNALTLRFKDGETKVVPVKKVDFN